LSARRRRHPRNSPGKAASNRSVGGIDVRRDFDCGIEDCRIYFIAAILLALPMSLLAQAPTRWPPAAAPAQTAKAAAPVDLTVTGFRSVTEDWIERMSPDSPPSGTGGARGLGPRGQTPPLPRQCGAMPSVRRGGSLRVPGRLHITWADDNTLKLKWMLELRLVCSISIPQRLLRARRLCKAIPSRHGN
jgi:hypothetical protein